MTIRFYFKLAGQLVQSLAHSGQTDAGFRARFTKPIQQLRWYAASAISYFKDHSFSLAPKTNIDLQSSRVAMNVRQTFLQHTEKRSLDRDGELMLPSACALLLLAGVTHHGQIRDRHMTVLGCVFIHAVLFHLLLHVFLHPVRCGI